MITGQTECACCCLYCAWLPRSYKMSASNTYKIIELSTTNRTWGLCQNKDWYLKICQNKDKTLKDYFSPGEKFSYNKLFTWTTPSLVTQWKVTFWMKANEQQKAAIFVKMMTCASLTSLWLKILPQAHDCKRNHSDLKWGLSGPSESLRSPETGSMGSRLEQRPLKHLASHLPHKPALLIKHSKWL
jgi:hypothetical protein